MWVWVSIIPGSTVAAERSTTVAPAGALPVHGPTLSMRLPRTTIAWSRRADGETPSTSVPAWMMTIGDAGMGVGLGGAAEAARAVSRPVVNQSPSRIIL